MRGLFRFTDAWLAPASAARGIAALGKTRCSFLNSLMWIVGSPLKRRRRQIGYMRQDFIPACLNRSDMARIVTRLWSFGLPGGLMAPPAGVATGMRMAFGS
tara:strand:+ start:1874 stop:2176 length:303 start_codon:yes stop_codon:yes gene_type:complete